MANLKMILQWRGIQQHCEPHLASSHWAKQLTNGALLWPLATNFLGVPGMCTRVPGYSGRFYRVPFPPFPHPELLLFIILLPKPGTGGTRYRYPDTRARYVANVPRHGQLCRFLSYQTENSNLRCTANQIWPRRGGLGRGEHFCLRPARTVEIVLVGNYC
eukprot:847050-Rhodomonas_salina.1